MKYKQSSPFVKVITFHLQLSENIYIDEILALGVNLLSLFVRQAHEVGDEAVQTW